MLRGGESLEQRKVLATAAGGIPEVTTLPNPLADVYLNATEAAAGLQIKVDLSPSGVIGNGSEKITLSINGVADPLLEHNLDATDVGRGFVAFSLSPSTFPVQSPPYAMVLKSVITDGTTAYTSGPLSFTVDNVAPNAPVLTLGTGVSDGATKLEATQASGVVTVIGESGATIDVTFRNGAVVPVTKTVTVVGSGATPVAVVPSQADVTPDRER